MKKKVWITLTLCMLICLSAMTVSAKKYQDSVFGLGIMDSADDTPMTRAEAAGIAVRLTGVDTGSAGAQTGFSDVAPEHPASAEIAMAQALGIASGDGTGLFHPDRAVSYQEFVKMICSALNYDIQAQSYGGFPDGYLKIAASLGISSAGISNVSELTRSDCAVIVGEALESYPVSWSYSGDTQVREEKLLAEKLMEDRDITYVTGIFTENERTSLISTEPGIEGNVRIGGYVYAAQEAYSQYMGQAVIAYVYDGSRVLYIAPRDGYNTMTQYYAEDYVKHSSGSVEFENDSNRNVTARIDQNALFVYNGRLSDAFEIIYNGTYQFLDNDRDSKADVVFINEIESFVAEKTNAGTMTVTFADQRTFEGKRSFFFEEDDDKIIDIYNADGSAAEFSDITPDMAVSFMSSKDGKLTTVYLSNTTVTGTVTGTSSEGEAAIDGTMYKVVRNRDGSLAYQCMIGNSGVYVIDAFGKLAGAAGSVASGESYGYVTKAYCDIDLDGAMAVKVISGSYRQKEVEVKQDTETISWYFTNNEPILLECRSDVRVNGSKGADDAIAQYITGSIISYKTDEDGKVKEITSYPCAQSSVGYSFNAKILSFGGFVETAQNKAFLIDDQTALIFVPEKTSPEFDDYLTKVKITDKSGGWKVCPVNIDEKTKVADAAVIYADMDFNVPGAIQYDDPIYMVGKVMLTDEDGEQVYRLTLLYKDEKKEVLSRSVGTAFATIEGLKAGDLVRYTTDHNGRIDGIVKLGGVKGLGDYYQKDVGDGNRQVYGIVEKSSMDMLYSVTNEMVDELVIGLGDDKDTVKYRISKEDDPPVYLYEKGQGWISATSTDAIVSRENVGDDASEVFLYVYNTDEVQAVVVIDN